MYLWPRSHPVFLTSAPSLSYSLPLFACPGRCCFYMPVACLDIRVPYNAIFSISVTKEIGQTHTTDT